MGEDLKRIIVHRRIFQKSLLVMRIDVSYVLTMGSCLVSIEEGIYLAPVANDDCEECVFSLHEKSGEIH
jgi:hypothetical protein